MRRDRAPRVHLRALTHRGGAPRGRSALLALILAAGASGAACDASLGLRELSAPEFGAADVGDAATGDAEGSGTLRGCAVATPASCGDPAQCCGDGERCVPAADGVSVCVAVGTLELDARCDGAAGDACGRGALCADGSSAGDGLRCRAVCASALDCDGRRCDVALDIGAEQVRLCE
ncbi:MAG: hypothetical protein H6698_02110 [Myxococcales bacterium]|nr:hypothetical protein [Myxococcales bacterium]MCB9519983.1 hypothetical protein [Myxococcales bacterium]MCB9533106.1 hypothetical protein [Myxococcales bacterium]